MDNLPDFTAHNYQVISCLGFNYQGGRSTYKAIEITTQKSVVIKQFSFASKNANWAGYKAVEREIEVLKSLKHPGIPAYLDSFDPGNGICLVQAYIDAQNLSIARNFTSAEIQSIAIQTLGILVYLQQQNSIVIHRDIKPENVLVDEDLNAYLVDFGLARIGGGEVTAVSSVVAGTPGFMPPEQLLGLALTKAADLYGLGATLICLFTGTSSTEINSLIDSEFRFNLQPFKEQLSKDLLEWLSKLVQPNLAKRFTDAQTALDELFNLETSNLAVPESEVIVNKNYAQNNLFLLTVSLVSCFSFGLALATGITVSFFAATELLALVSISLFFALFISFKFLATKEDLFTNLDRFILGFASQLQNHPIRYVLTVFAGILLGFGFKFIF